MRRHAIVEFFAVWLLLLAASPSTFPFSTFPPAHSSSDGASSGGTSVKAKLQTETLVMTTRVCRRDPVIDADVHSQVRATNAGDKRQPSLPVLVLRI